LKFNKIYQGHAIEVQKTFPDECVDCVVTSPPYWNMRNYATDPIIWGGDKSCDHEWGPKILTGQTTPQTKYQAAKEAFTQTGSCFCLKCGAWKGELGAEPTIALFVNNLCDVFDETLRILKSTGSCFVNMGDTYYSNHGSGNPNKVNREVTDQLLSRKNRTKAKELPEHCLCMIPYRFSIEMINRGWILKNLIQWEKDNAMPQSAKRRFTVNFEPIFFFVKSNDYRFEQQFEPCVDESNKEGRNMRCIWRINTEGSRVKHWAAYPRKLVQIPIAATCPPDGVVLDPFVGTGTTCRVAYDLDRKYIGIDLNPNFVEISERRLDQKNIFEMMK